ncbi:hypothetical protein BV22DRAFT_564152 [Leucogyrophana mollusca]|uniref:Uncharacterized protein n=1 Tax=Leucogyrophana mollusca TaxID=85980 RepID=A0ACB8BFT7_9AGAM|nr:hypothetical protein BV22DRAFT_564152 [Leucogyrophana mollusca]
MFIKLISFALSLHSVSALVLNTPTELTSGAEATITWTSQSGDPSTFSLLLKSYATFAIADNVQTSLETITLELPEVPSGNEYILEATNISDIDVIYATTGEFTVIAAN